MSNDLVVLEKQLTSLAPQFEQALGSVMTPSRLIRTVLVSAERTRELLDCSRQSLFNSTMSAAVLALEVDGVTGQAFLIPFKDRRAGETRAQLVIGYKGYNTLAARSRLTVSGAVVREGDGFDYELGDRGFVKHKPKLGGRDRRIIAAWAVAAALDRPAVVCVLGIDDLLATKAKSPGAKRSDSPWNDESIGFPAMCEKTAKRRLARSMPLNIMQLAARMDEAHEEQGRYAYITPDRGVVIEGDASPFPERESETPTAQQLLSPSGRPATPSTTADEAALSVDPPTASGADGAADTLPDWDWSEYVRRMSVMCDEAQSGTQLGNTWNSDFHKQLRRKLNPTADQLEWLKDRVAYRIKELQGAVHG